MLMMDVPSPTTQGESVELICSYRLDEDKLYSVKWYKDDVEFYRYVPNDWPPGQFLPLKGVRVDLSKSGSQSVYLRHVDLNSAGVYRCEVSAEAPEFQTVEAEKPMKVFVLPTEGPSITGGRSKYRLGDTVSVNCTSSKSKPAATLRWYINDELATPDNELEHSTTLHADGLETSSLNLRFAVNDQHFRSGNMKLKCTATISRVYTMSNEELFFGSGLRQQTSGLHITENMSHVQNRSSRMTSVQLIPLYLLLIISLKFMAVISSGGPFG
uniref:Ig-like domain-containing protein n=1 Tax=Parasteatoda tepidariorum TaxID=114398 RepID=A0A2L2YQC1_PARTP